MKLSRTLAEKVVAAWFVRLGYQTHRAEASFRRIPTGGSCATCHRRYERTFSVSHDLFGIFDGVSVKPALPRVWWQVTTVSRSAEVGPRGGTSPHFGNVSARKRKVGELAPQFAPDVVLIFGASSVRQGRSARRFFYVWWYDFAAKGWERWTQTLDVFEDDAGHPYVADTAGIALAAAAAALARAAAGGTPEDRTP